MFDNLGIVMITTATCGGVWSAMPLAAGRRHPNNISNYFFMCDNNNIIIVLLQRTWHVILECHNNIKRQYKYLQ